LYNIENLDIFDLIKKIEGLNINGLILSFIDEGIKIDRVILNKLKELKENNIKICLDNYED
jgi:hypothetical protein